MKRLLTFVLVIAGVLCSARAESPDDQYVRIYNTIQEADSLNVGGKPTAALTKNAAMIDGIEISVGQCAKLESTLEVPRPSRIPITPPITLRVTASIKN